ncbi:MAG: succinylglutamate desuccinylase/aspartoacylase family protein [Candidatus Bathyarchaeia archaeon]|jgi:predicted deacylase
MPKTLKVENVQAESGEKNFGFVKVAETPSDSVSLPVWIINGNKDGPTLCLTAGLHPCEYVAVEAVIRTCRKLEPSNLHGTIIAVPVINIPAFRARSPYVNPIDNVNLMFLYPAMPNGSISHRIVHVVLNEIIAKADYHIDCHGGEPNEAMDPYVVFPKVNNEEVDTKSEAMARIFGLADLDRRTPERAKGLFLEAAKMGVPSIMSEAGGIGVITEEDVAIHMNGIRNILQYVGILDGSPQINVRHKIEEKKFDVVADRGGIAYRTVGTGTIVSAGQKVAEIKDLQGETVSVLEAPDNGKIKLIFTYTVVNTGDPIMTGWAMKDAGLFPQTDKFYVGK